MPVENMDAIRNSRVVSEHRKIKIGEKGSGDRAAPKRYKAPVVTMPKKGPGGGKFDVDELTMNAIRTAQNLPLSVLNKEHKAIEGRTGPDIKGVPVRLLSDNIDEILYSYFAAYNSYGRALCKSDFGDPKAQRWFTDKDPGANKGEKKGKFFILHQPFEVECSPSACEWWPKPGEKGPCQPHGIVGVQLEHSRVFPQPTRFRTSGPTLMKYLRGSLNKIAAVTGGILANIPLQMIEVEVESNTAKEGKRTHPVMEFTFFGTMDELREAAIRELDSRRRLKAALSGVNVGTIAVQAGELTAGVIAAGEQTADDTGVQTVAEGDRDDFVDFDDPETTVTEAPTPKAQAPTEDTKAADAMIAEVEDLRKRANVSDRSFDALCDKHGGDMVRVRDELKKLAGADAAVVTQAAAPASPATPAASAVDDDSDWGFGDDSNEPSETTTEPAAAAAGNGEEKKAAPAAAGTDKKPATLAASDDDFPVFED